MHKNKSRASRKRSPGKRRGGRGESANWPIARNVPKIPRMSLLMPPEMDTPLQFTLGGTLNNSVGVAVSKRFRPTSPRDVDPLLGSTSTPGFSEWVNFYGMARVVSYTYSWDVVNKETFPMLAIVVNTNTDPGIAGYGSQMGNPVTQKHLISGSAGGPCRYTFRGRHKIVDIVGSGSPELDDSYAALTTTDPINNTFIGLGIDGIGNTLTNGVTFLLKLTIWVRFYERKLLTS